MITPGHMLFPPIVLMFLLLQTSLSAGDHNCPDVFSDGRAEVVLSGRMHQMEPKIRELLHELNRVSGLLDQLGIYVPKKHIYTFVQGSRLARLVANNSHAVGHWLDGREILKQVPDASSILEFVPPHAADFARSVYQDTESVETLVHIFIHVAGHVHFNKHTKFAQSRGSDAFTLSFELHQLMESLKQQTDPEEVDDWYFLLASLRGSQDYARGSPLPNGNEEGSAQLFHYYVKNLPPNTPPWKRQMAELYARLHSYESGFVSTKIINEGFATFLQEIAFPYLNDRSMPYFIAGTELDAAFSKSLSNPYWLGREAFRRIKSRFELQRHANGQSTSGLEFDRALLEHITEDFIAQFDNFDFLKHGLDAQWVYQNKLAILRPHNENDPEVQPIGEFDEENYHPYKIVTRDPTTVIDAIAKTFADKEARYPRALERSLNYNNSGRARLYFNDQYGLNHMLDPTSLGETLVAHARFLAKPVEIETIVSGMLDIGKRVQKRILVSVEPSGSVQITSLGKSTKFLESKPFIKWKEKVEQAAKIFASQLGASGPLTNIGDQIQAIATSSESLIGTMIQEQISSTSVEEITHSPTWASAIAAYQSEYEKRMGAAFSGIQSGDTKIIRGASGIKVQLFPYPPALRFWNRELDLTPKVGWLKTMSRPSLETLRLKSRGTITLINGLVLSENDYPEGEWIWGPPPNQGQQGDESDEDVSDTDFGDSNDPSQNPGGGSLDPRYEELPLDFYAEALALKIELPRLKPKAGISSKEIREDEGVKIAQDGRTHKRAVLKCAMQIGIAKNTAQEGESFDPSNWDHLDLLTSGLAGMSKQQWRVYDSFPTPEPNVNAVVTIIVDFSGSMYGQPLMNAKKTAYDLRALLMRKYKNLVFRFIAFDDTPRVYESADDFFRLQLGGGTNYREGFSKALEVLKDFPRSSYDRYTFVFGDLEDFESPAPMDAVRDLYDQNEFMGVVHTTRHHSYQGSILANDLMQMASEEPWMSYVTSTNSESYSTQIIADLFKNAEP